MAFGSGRPARGVFAAGLVGMGEGTVGTGKEPGVGGSCASALREKPRIKGRERFIKDS